MKSKNHSIKLALAAGAIAAALVTTNAYAQQGMGVGNNNPQEMLDVSGAIKLGTTTTTNAGTIRWTGTEFQGWDGTQWITFGGGIATQLTEAQVEAFVTNGPIDLFAGTTLNGSPILTTEVDGSTTNEIQDLQLVGNILTITNNGSPTSIDLSPYVNSLIGLDDAYDNGSTITADAGPVIIDGPDGIDVTGNALIGGIALIGNDALIGGTADIAGNAYIGNDANIFGNAFIGDELFTGSANISNDAIIGGNTDILGTLNLPNGAAADYIAVSDATGAVTWTDPATITTGDDGDWTVNGTDISNANTGNVGIGTNAPTEILDVNGQIRMRTGATSGYVPASDANGVMIWTDPNTLVTPTTTNTLDGAYDQGGAGAGREIDAVDGTVAITGEDGIMVSGTFGSGLAVGATGGIADGAGTRMFFNPNKAAFRAGYVSGTQWDDANIGNYSTAMGSGTIASGDISTAMGANTDASGDFSTAMGFITTASGDYSTAMGQNTTASAYISTAMGQNTNAFGNSSTAMGYFTNAAGGASTAMGYQTNAAGDWSTAMGEATFALGDWSTAMGVSTTASGNTSTAMGDGTNASGPVSTAMGSSTTASGDFSTAMGSYTNATGPVSTAMGQGTIASGYTSTAMGGGTTASGFRSTAMGEATTASGPVSTAMGGGTTASGDFSTAMGVLTTASGNVSTAMGEFATAPSYVETAIGRYNTTYTPSSTTGWNAADRLFVVGNGTGTSARSDAMVVLKNGNTGFGTSTPTSNVHIKNTGDASIWIEADSDNVTESDNAYLKITQDGNLVNSIIGLSGADNLSPTGDAYTGVRANALLIGTETSLSDLQLGTNNAVRMTIAKTTGRVGIRTTAPTSDLHLKMSASDFPNPTTGGITLEQSNSTDEWQIWNSAPNLSFAWNNVRVAYVNNNSGAWTVTSDRRVKKDIEPMEDVLSKVMQLNTVKYRYNHNADDATKTRGFIAQEVQEVFPDLVYSEDGSQLGIAPSDFGILSIKAIQEQQAQIEAQQKLINELLQRIEQLENR